MKTQILACLDTISEISPPTQLVQISAIRVNFFYQNIPIIIYEKRNAFVIPARFPKPCRYIISKYSNTYKVQKRPCRRRIEMKTQILACLDTISEISPPTQLVQISAIRVNFFYQNIPIIIYEKRNAFVIPARFPKPCRYIISKYSNTYKVQKRPCRRRIEMKTQILACLDTISEISPPTQLVQISAIRVNFFYQNIPIIIYEKRNAFVIPARFPKPCRYIISKYSNTYKVQKRPCRRKIEMKTPILPCLDTISEISPPTQFVQIRAIRV